MYVLKVKGFIIERYFSEEIFKESESIGENCRNVKIIFDTKFQASTILGLTWQGGVISHK